MIENVFRYKIILIFYWIKCRLVVDPLYPPPFEWPSSRKNLLPENCYEYNKFELIFDERDDYQKGISINAKQNGYKIIFLFIIWIGILIDEYDEYLDDDAMD